MTKISRLPPNNISVRSPDIREMKLKDCFPGELVRWVYNGRVVDGIIGESTDENTTTFVTLRGLKEKDFTVRNLNKTVSGKFLNFGTAFLVIANPSRSAFTDETDLHSAKGVIVFEDGRWLLQVVDERPDGPFVTYLNLNGGNFQNFDQTPVRCLDWRIDLMQPPGYPPLNFLNVEVKRPEPKPVAS